MDINNELEQKAKELDKQATEALKRQVKSMIVAKGYIMEKLAERLRKICAQIYTDGETGRGIECKVLHKGEQSKPVK